MYSAELVMKLNTIANRYKAIINQALSQLLNQPKYRNTGAGANSLKVEVIDGDSNKSPIIKITFDEHILLLDKRKLQWTKLSNVKNLIAWSRTKTFSRVPGYKGSGSSIDKMQASKRVAFAIAVKQKKTDSWKAKPWRKKGLSQVLKDMNKFIIDGYQQAIDEEISNTVKKAA